MKKYKKWGYFCELFAERKCLDTTNFFVVYDVDKKFTPRFVVFIDEQVAIDLLLKEKNRNLDNPRNPYAIRKISFRVYELSRIEILRVIQNNNTKTETIQTK